VHHIELKNQAKMSVFKHYTVNLSRAKQQTSASFFIHAFNARVVKKTLIHTASFV